MSVRRNTIYNVAGSLLPLAVTLFTVPKYLELIGAERFGALAIAWVLLGYFSLFDLGFSRATAQRVAALGDAEPNRRADTVWTALVLNAGFGVLGGLFLWLAAHFFFTNLFQLSEALRPEIIEVIPWLVVAVPMTTVSGVLSGALHGRERFLEMNLASVFGSVLFQVLPLSVAWLYSPTLTWLLPAALLSRLLTVSVLFVQCWRYLPLAGPPTFDRTQVVPLFRFGGWVTVTSVVGPLLMVWDRFLIGALAGATAVTHYTVPFSLAHQVTVLPASLASALFPRLAAAEGDERNRLAEEAIRALTVVVTPLIIAALFLVGPFLTWWLSADFAASATVVGQILFLGLWANCLAQIPYTRLQAQGRPDLVAKAHLAELIPYVAFLYVALANWGIAGAAVAWSARIGVDCLLLFALSAVSLKTVRSFAAPCTLLSFAAFGALVLPNGSAIAWLTGSIALVMSLLWGSRTGAPLLTAYLPRRFP